MSLQSNEKNMKMMKWEMLGGNFTWVNWRTAKNAKLIVKFLKEKSKDKKYKPMYSYAQLAKQLSLQHKQVQFACQKLAFRVKQSLRIHAISYGSKEGGKISEKVEYIFANNSDE